MVCVPHGCFWDGKADGFVVAVGATEPLAEQMMVADFFRKSILKVVDEVRY